MDTAYSYALKAEENTDHELAERAISSIDTAHGIIIDGEETYCYNERNELTERKILSAVIQYMYDENGSLVGEKEGSKSASYQYDLLNRQSHVRMHDGREQENFYDGEGLRAGISESGKAWESILYISIGGKIDVNMCMWKNKKKMY